MKTFRLREHTSFSHLFFLIFIPMGNLPSDTEYSVATAASICEGNFLWNPPNFPNLKTGRDGLSYSKYGIAYAFLFLRCFPGETTATVIPVEEIFLLYGLAVFTNTIIAPLQFFFSSDCSVKWILRKNHSLNIISIAAGSILLPYSKITHSETHHRTASCISAKNALR